ncbi:membrane protein [Aquiluna sp. KACHI24]|nr:membrane protein [Aquiluna sp. KACHI24]
MVALAALPFGLELALTLGVLVPTLLFALASLLAPKISLTDLELRAGSFSIPREIIGEVRVLDQQASRFERGPGLNANARMLLRGDIATMIKIEILDPQDPTPYLLISTRRGELLASALRANRA